MFVESLEGRMLFAGVAKFLAPLLGATEVPPNNTPAHGTIKMKLSKDGSTLTYKMAAKKIDNVVDAHIHLAAPGVDGPIVVDLMEPAGQKVGRHKFSVRGTITAAEFVGPMAGLTMADLVAQMTAGGAYVNVHTSDGVDPPDTGPGDFPNGEIRGQLQRVAKKKSGGAGQASQTPTPTPPGMPGY